MMKRPICMVSTEGKTAEQIADEAWEALQKYQEAQQAGEHDNEQRPGEPTDH